MVLVKDAIIFGQYCDRVPGPGRNAAESSRFGCRDRPQTYTRSMLTMRITHAQQSALEPCGGVL
ncbi:hypothetical protein D477_010421 [Arthrobacter crystallopoietes BAB-32]|uniref:Uncharacterized protein n=1 Tax=Arthrobacter crystallopoietes BAB-32 TaxID=1246476 RepID=N1UZ45_9MICC|nr:hypothetical protein [Arthrobacter crystallopoietes]EMY34310.1 hypothetical protein D477_010421 [Arthrobacter crystallopoietes BAB-32]